MKIVVDSNIVFSAILNTQSKIGQLLINGSKYFDFYTVGLLKDEIIEHKDKILRSTKFTPTQFSDTFQLIINRIIFLDDILLTDKDLNKAIDLVTGIDENDALFVALNNHLLANLWTGDKRLLDGLKGKGYSRVVTTNDLYEIFLDKQLKNRQKSK
ncbi:MAG TPA: PIN domain-containing protein [Prolixibacteraceae bacterium]